MREPSGTELSRFLAERNQDSTVMQAGRDLHIYVPTRAAQAMNVSLAPPLGRLDQHRPLRGRTQCVQDLIQLLRDPYPSPRVRILTGLGGCGKTSVALSLARDALSSGIDTWWVDASDPAVMVAGMQAVARRLGAAADELATGDIADLLWERLGSRDEPWLLVLDNADDPERLAAPRALLADGIGWLRPISHGTGLVVVTSRDGREEIWGSWSKLHPIGMLSPQDGAQMLMDYTSGRAGQRRDAARLSARLGGLPLALRFAGSYLSETTATPWPDEEAITSFGDYLKAVNSGRADALEDVPTGSLTATAALGLIGQAWDLSLSLLEKRGLPASRPLLRLLACLGDVPVPYQVMLDPALVSKSPLFPGMTGQELWRVIRALSGLSLVENLIEGARDSSDGPATLTLHPLVRDANRQQVDGETSAEDFFSLAAKLALSACYKVDREQQFDPATWASWQLLAPHCFHLLRWAAAKESFSIGASREASEASLVSAKYLIVRGQLRQAESQFRELAAIVPKLLGPSDDMSISVQYGLGQALHDCRLNAEAINEYEKLLVVLQALGKPADIAMTRSQIAHILAHSGRYGEAERSYRSILADVVETSGVDSDDAIYIRHEMALILFNRELIREAESEMRSVLETRERLSDVNSRPVLWASADLAIILMNAGKFSEASDLFERVLAANIKQSGSDGVAAWNARLDIALLLKRQGRWSESEEDYRAVLEARRRLEGRDHPRTAMVQGALGSLYHDMKQYNRAEAEYGSAITALRKSLGFNHVVTLGARLSLAHLLSQHLHREQEAERELRVIFSNFSRRLGSADSQTIEARNELADLLRRRGRTYEADQLQRKSIPKPRRGRRR